MKLLLALAVVLWFPLSLFSQTTLLVRFSGSMLADSAGALPLSHPAALALDPDGNLYLADTGNHRIIKSDAQGRLLREAGGFGFGNEQFDRPVDLWAGNGLDVFVADYNNQRLQRYDKDLNFISSYSSGDFWEENLRFGYPAAVALSPQGELFIADHEFKRLLRFDAFGKPKASFADFNWGEGGIERPAKILISARGEIFVSDSMRQAVMIYDAFGNFTGKLGEGLLERPCGLAEWRELIFVADRSRRRIAGFTRTGDFVAEFGNDGTLRGTVALAFASSTRRAEEPAFTARAYVLDAAQNCVQVFEVTLADDRGSR